MRAAENDGTILVREDDLEVCEYLKTALSIQGDSVEAAGNSQEVLSHFQECRASISAIVIYVPAPGKDGISTLNEIRRLDQHVPVIVISGFASPRKAVEAIRNAANDFMAKPVNPDDLRKSLKMALQTKPGALPAEPANERTFFSASPRMRELQELIGAVGPSEAPVLIQGETGVGKEVFARELHARSPRSERQILKLNCAALPSELVESELFGYERGAFTGAFQRKPGMFELADGGAILLDEIGDMEFRLQAKLLQVLQDHEFQRLGGRETVKVDVRVIAATHRDLEEAIAQQNFREDLYYRLNLITMRVPPLRERKEDIIPLANFLMRKHTAPDSTPLEVPPELQEAFLNYHWPGNVRELENTIRKFLILRNARQVAEDLRRKTMIQKPVNEPVAPKPPVEPAVPAAAAAPVASVPAVTAPAFAGFAAEGKVNGASEGGAPIFLQVANAKRDAERTAILAALKATNWNRRRASALLHVDYKALLYKMKVLSIKKEPRDGRPGGKAWVSGGEDPPAPPHTTASLS